MLTLALLIEYDGTGFYGFQKQGPGVRTIQFELEKVLSVFANEKIDVITSGRTDTGVHATYQVISFTTTAKRELYNWIRGINALLPKDIIIRAAVNVDAEFNARFSAISRTYHYYLRVDPVRPAILYKKVGWYYAPLDCVSMQAAGQQLVGKQDFSSFRAADCQAKNPVRNLSYFNMSRKNNLIRFEFTANAFLYHMVRNIVGALIYVGNGKLSQQGFAELITAKKRTLAPPTFMPDGLYLTHIEYKSVIFAPDNNDWLF